ncbi:hypothetical protein CYMTET_43768 [Cymbomonas tetramitiformis]|uniref:THIF-type NAD/FAD binding fold domain-containing protein n=1 Tax=Cymbomonas tetramitiformis TaxID=36881 RepID=A0AAE0C1H1_9CHLO|nr:hypothetical protein CYMTET_43768 [Cymbomonas tetramitiformis]
MSDDDHQMEEALGSPSLEDLYSRQIFAIGPKAMQDISSSGVLVIGANALGSEIAKNLVLAGVSTIAMYDNEPVQPRDLSAQFFLRESDIGTSRAEACVGRLRDLSDMASVSAHTGPALDSDLIRTYQAIVAATGTFEELCVINSLCRSAGVPFVCGASRGLFAVPTLYLSISLFVRHNDVLQWEECRA